MNQFEGIIPTLQSIIIVTKDLERQDASVEKYRHWLEELKKQFRVYFYEQDKPLKAFFLVNGIRRETALFLADRRELLIEAETLEVAVIACEASENQGGMLEDHSGFSMVALDVWEQEPLFFLRCYQREKGLPWTIMETRRLIIREEYEEDLERIYQMYEQEHVIQFLEPPYPDKEQELDYIRKYRKYIYGYYGYGLWHLIEKETGQSVGRAGLNPKTYSDDVSGVELGYMIVEPFLRQGYCMECCSEILKYAKEELELERVYCLIKPENTVSIHIAEKLGFILEKPIRDNNREMMRFVCELKGN